MNTLEKYVTKGEIAISDNNKVFKRRLLQMRHNATARGTNNDQVMNILTMLKQNPIVQN